MPACLQRYLAGERIEVWNELMALGEAVRSKPAPAGVNAVIDETMRRARHNIEVLIPRLSGMGYRFAAPAIERELQKIDNQIAEPKINPYVLKLRQKAVAEGRMPASHLLDFLFPLPEKKVALVYTQRGLGVQRNSRLCLLAGQRI